MRSILRSTLLASSALTMTYAFSGCEDTSKPVTPETPPAASSPADAPASGKMDGPASGKMDGPATTPPAAEKPADAPK